MKIIASVLLLLVNGFLLAQINTNINQTKTPNNWTKKVDTKTIKKVPIASEVDVYMNFAKGIYTNNELYALMRSEPSKIKLFAIYYGVTTKREIIPLNGIFPSIHPNYDSIRFKVPIVTPEKPTYIVACIENIEISSKQITLRVENSSQRCSEIVPKNNFFGITENLTALSIKMDDADNYCSYPRIIPSPKTIQFFVDKI